MPVCIDEIEKMSEHDRSTMHESLEQQCMLPDFRLMLSNGKYVEIGAFIDDLMLRNKNKIYKGIECEILPTNEVELISTDFYNSFPLKADRVSRHTAPKNFIKISLVNGRNIMVTPEHPCWVVEKGRIITIPAEKLSSGMFFPIPSEISIKEADYKKENDTLCKILGYHISDGCYELNRGKKTGIQFANKDTILINDYKDAVESYFNLKAGLTKQGDVFSVRVISKKVKEEIMKIDKTLMEKGIIKTFPDGLMNLPKENLKYFLRAIFDGDGTVTFQKRNGCRATLVTENFRLAEQVSDILLRFGIISSIFKDRAFFKVDITGQENLMKFLINISFLSEKKKNRLKEYCEKNKSYKSIRDVIPNCTEKISEIFKKLNISMNKELGHSIDLHVEKHRLFLQKLILTVEKHIKKDTSENLKKEVENLKKLAFGYARWVKIKEIKEIENKDTKYVYDITIEPNRTFVSNGMILHNTVTISKANIQATLRSETSVLAAGNPKLGRFDPHIPIPQQINISPALLSRFDVIFILRDLPNRVQDEAIARHVLEEHQENVIRDVIDPKLLRKYIAYARKKVKPKLTDEAAEEIREFYITIRNKTITSSSDVKPIPITARQLEAIVRLSEACAKVRLSNYVTVEDTRQAIKLLKYSMMQVGYDEETQSFDIDRVTTGIPTSKRNKIIVVREAISRLESSLGKLIPVIELEKELGERMSKEDLEDAINQLSKIGDIFKPKTGYIQKL